MFVKTFQVIYLAANCLDLFLHNRHTPCEVVMLTNLTSQFLDLRVGNSLGSLQFSFHSAVAADVRNDYTNQSQTTCNYGADNSLHRLHPQQAAPGGLAAAAVSIQLGALLIGFQCLLGGVSERAIGSKVVLSCCAQKDLQRLHSLTLHAPAQNRQIQSDRFGFTAKGIDDHLVVALPEFLGGIGADMYEIVIQADALDADGFRILRHFFGGNALDPDICRHAFDMVGAGTAADLGISIVLGTAVAAVDVDTLTEVIPDLLEPYDQLIVHQNGVTLTAFALEFVQLEILRNEYGSVKDLNYMPNEYWDFSKSGKENAEAYLKMCARNNKRPKFYKLLQNNGDGSYSLKTDGSTDGYWNGVGYYAAAKDAFHTFYGTKTTFSINQLGISAEADYSFAKESLSKARHTKEMQTILDLTPAFKQLIEESRLLAVERTLHNDNKKTSLLCYRLYNAYIREEVYTDEIGKKQTRKVPHIVVFNVVQTLQDAKAHMVTDINDVAIYNGHNSSKLKYAAQANGNIIIGSIADVYDIVKGIDREKGGLNYSASQKIKYGFNYTEREDGTKYSDRDTESVSNRSLLANAFEGVAQNEIEQSKIQEYKGKIDLIEAEEKKLRDLNERIKALSFAKGPRDKETISKLREEAHKTANRINIYDKQLLRLEASKPLQAVLEREKKKAYKRAEQKGKEALEAYREKATKTQRELLERWQESRKKGVESRRSSHVRSKIKDFKSSKKDIRPS